MCDGVEADHTREMSRKPFRKIRSVLAWLGSVIVASGLLSPVVAPIAEDAWEWAKRWVSREPVTCLMGVESMLGDGRWEAVEHGSLREEVDKALECADSAEKGEVVYLLFEAGVMTHGETRMDMTGADLSEADLRNGDLHRISLAGADLTDADLRGVDLYDDERDELRGANLTDIDAAGMRLEGADVKNVVLEGANLRGARLCRATLDYAKVDHRTDLSGAMLKDASLEGVILTQEQLISADFQSECED